jgi:hypothetical protein
VASSAENRVRSIKRAHRAAKLADGEVLAVTTPDGKEVHIAGLTVVEDGTRSYVDVTLDGVPEGGDPSFRIVNPPTLVPDPTGDVVVRGMRFRNDPVGAIAMVLANNGGAAQKARTRRGRR